MKGRRIARAAAAGAAALTVLSAGGGVAFANGGDAIGLDIRDSSVRHVSTSGQCDWTVVSKVTVVNLARTPIAISAVVASASWTGGSASGVVGATVLADGGLTAGDSVPPGATVSYQPYETSFSIPCKASFGDLAVRITDQYGTGSGDAPFLSDGVSLPVTALGGVGLAAVSGVSLLALQRRRRSRLLQPAMSDPNVR